MKKAILVALAVIGTFSAGAQFKAPYVVTNGPGFVRIQTTVTGMDTAALHGVRSVTVSNNANMNPVVAGLVDTFATVDSVSFTDSLNVSVLFPRYFYAKVMTLQVGATVDTALALPHVPVLITPAFTAMTASIGSLSSTTLSGSFSASFTSGYDTGMYKVIISYGDTTFANPVWNYPAATGSITPVIGVSNQTRIVNPSFTIGVPNYPYSLRVIYGNTVKADTSAIYYGWTLPAPAPGTVSTPIVTASADTIVTTAVANTNGLATTVKSYYAICSTCAPIDSTTTVLTGNPTVQQFSQKKVVPTGATYWVWCSAVNAQSVSPMVTNKVTVHVAAPAPTFTISIDSVVAVGADEAEVYARVVVPPGGTSDNLTFLLARTSDLSLYEFVLPLAQATPGVNSYKISVTGLQAGVSYTGSIYGSDALFTKLYVPFEEKIVFTHTPPTTSIPVVTPIVFEVYPNPATSDLTIKGEADAFYLYNIQGQMVKKMEHPGILNTSLYARGQYILVAQKGTTSVTKRIVLQ